MCAKRWGLMLSFPLSVIDLLDDKKSLGGPCQRPANAPPVECALCPRHEPQAI
jgi:hypothetical protein